MSAVFYTSDLHIGHRLVANERAERAGVVLPAMLRTPEETDEALVAWHDDTLAKNWDKVVSPSDMVVVVGDISAGGSASWRRALSWISQRPGRKRLVAGNHDPVHGMHRDAFKHFAAFMESFESVESFARIRAEGTACMVSHFPYTGDHSPEDRYSEYRLRDTGVPVIHGHTHSMEKVSFSTAGTAQIHVGADAWGMAPVRASEVVGIARQNELALP